MEILTRLERESVDLCRAAQESAGDIRRQDNAMSAPGQERIIASIISNAGSDLAFGRLALLE